MSLAKDEGDDKQPFMYSDSVFTIKNTLQRQDSADSFA